MMPPESLSEVLILPVLLTMIGLIIYWAGVARALSYGEVKKFRWVGIILLMLALFVGVRYLWNMIDPSMGAFYRGAISGRRILYAHYVAPAMPFLSLLGVFILDIYLRKRAAETRQSIF